MPEVKDKEVHIEQATNGFIVRTEKRVKREIPEGVTPTADQILYPSYDWIREEHVAATLEAAMPIISGFFTTPG